MNLKEAYNMMDLSMEEIASIERYLGFKHTNINILSDFRPVTYNELKSKGWVMPQKVEDIKSDIQDFVNIYSAMYKESRKKSFNRELVRGTSNKRVREIEETIPQFLSTSTDENVAKTFTQYGDGALIYFHIDEQVPFLDPTPYRSENSADEKEIILAPFCKTTIHSERQAREENGFSYYKATVQKTELEEKTPEELNSLKEEVLSRFSQNIEEIKELSDVEFKLEELARYYKQAQGDIKEQAYILKVNEQTQEKYDNLRKSTNDFKNKLQSLLKGMCRQKEIEIEQAHKTVDEDKQRKKDEEEKQIKEENERREALAKEQARRNVVATLSDKLAQTPQNAASLQNSVVNIYETFMHDENKIELIVQKFGFSLDRSIQNSSIEQLVIEIQNNIQSIAEKVGATSISEATTLEDAKKTSIELTPMLDGVSYGKELASSFPEIQKLYRQQLEERMKKGIYGKVQQVLQSAKTQKYLQEKEQYKKKKLDF